MSIAPTTVVQFGTSRFLQAHADLFFSEGDPRLSVTVVQSSGDATRARRLAALADPAGFPVRIRGMENGQRVDRGLRVTSVKRALSTATDWDAVADVVAGAEIVLSNTSDTGFAPQPADRDRVPDQRMSYPAKLFHLLAHRFERGLPPPLLMPAELIPANGDVLKNRVLEIATEQAAAAAFKDWLAAMPAANSLVDRIVSEPIEPAGAVAEPYALWAIEAAPGVAAPCRHPAIQVVADLEPIERLKLHILNLGHTVLASLWLKAGGPPDAIVRDAIAGEDGRRLDAVWAEEVLPGFALRGMEDAARAYMAVTRERFANPFLDHRIADIAGNHAEKVRRRIGAFRTWVAEVGSFDMPVLAAIEAGA